MWYVSGFFGYLLAGIIGSVLLLVFSEKLRNILYMLKVRNALRSITITEITNELQCVVACTNIKSHCQDLSVLGFDCEWVTQGWEKRPVALLQLATVHGLCCLFRLNVLGTVNSALEELLNDRNIIKLGIDPLNDSKLLRRDYGVQVTSALDLRYLYPRGGGLASLAASELGLKLDKSFRLRCSNWEAAELTESQKDYAAKDAFAAVEMFKKWLLMKNKIFNLYTTKINYNFLYGDDLKAEVSKFLDINFKSKGFLNTSVKWNKRTILPEGLNQKKERSNCITRQSPPYHNCFMHAPDGELLCSCDKRKAQWYVERGLAEVLPGEPYSIRLLFEPAARSGETNGGRFYQHLKQNCCVVCGAQQSYLKHNVVPKEYRRHFPNIMKEHQSHDVVLMCLACHHVASCHNEKLRQKLAFLCNAPITTSKMTQSKTIQKVKNGAKALLNSANVIPLEKKLHLENEIKKYFEVDNVTQEVLLEAANLESRIVNKNYESHGIKVVNYFAENTGGLTKLEILWREHFLNTMKPQHLPALWSVTHNHSRLAAKAEGKQL